MSNNTANLSELHPGFAPIIEQEWSTEAVNTSGRVFYTHTTPLIIFSVLPMMNDSPIESERFKALYERVDYFELREEVHRQLAHLSMIVGRLPELLRTIRRLKAMLRQEILDDDKIATKQQRLDELRPFDELLRSLELSD